MIKKSLILTLALCLLLAWTAAGEIITYGLNYEFSGATAPTGPTPWLTVTFDDDETPGSVRLILENTNLVAFEYTNNWYLNLDPLLDPTALSFDELGRAGFFATPDISASVDNYKADGDGYFDILFDFDESAGSRFGAGESIEYLISGIQDLTASSFDFYSTPSGGNGTYHSAAHIGAIFSTFSAGQDVYGCPEGSGWIGDTEVPEPASVLLLAMGGLGMLLRRKR